MYFRRKENWPKALFPILFCSIISVGIISAIAVNYHQIITTVIWIASGCGVVFLGLWIRYQKTEILHYVVYFIGFLAVLALFQAFGIIR